jgi:hypothetical protein
MGRRPNWIPQRKYNCTPHASDPAASLWWYRLQESKREQVIATYIKQCSRGRALPEGFRDDLEMWLRELNTEQRIAPRTRRFWTIPSYAAANRMHSKTFCKRFRELEKIAKRLFSDDVPVGRVTVALTEEKVGAIRARFGELVDDLDAFSKIAQEFGIDPFRVGQLCRDLKAQAITGREKAAAAAKPSDKGYPFNDELL